MKDENKLASQAIDALDRCRNAYQALMIEHAKIEKQLKEAREIIQLHAGNGSPSAKEFLWRYPQPK